MAAAAGGRGGSTRPRRHLEGRSAGPGGGERGEREPRVPRRLPAAACGVRGGVGWRSIAVARRCPGLPWRDRQRGWHVVMALVCFFVGI